MDARACVCVCVCVCMCICMYVCVTLCEGRRGVLGKLEKDGLLIHKRKIQRRKRHPSPLAALALRLDIDALGSDVLTSAEHVLEVCGGMGQGNN